MDGIRNISPGRNVQLIPSVVFTTARYLDQLAPAGPQFKTSTEVRPGIDGKVVIKDAFTLDVTVRPDYSQVESDEPQVTVNQRFEVYFPEKRPFFMENAGYFKTPQQIFFSRRIIDPLAGARLTGKQGKWSIGSLLVADRGPGQAVAEVDPLSGRTAFDAVVRVQRELKGSSNAALMATSTDFGPSHNRVLSADTRLQLLPNWILTGQAMTSDTRLPDGRHLNGPGLLSRLGALRQALRSRRPPTSTAARVSSPTSASSIASISAIPTRLWATNGGRRAARSKASVHWSPRASITTASAGCRTGASTPASRSSCRA